MNDKEKFVKEVFELAQTDEIAQMARETVEAFKREYKPVELKESEIFNVIKASYIAKRFFNRSRFWINHKINHNIVNGKRADFTDQERQTLKKAIETIALELQALSDSM